MVTVRAQPRLYTSAQAHDMTELHLLLLLLLAKVSSAGRASNRVASVTIVASSAWFPLKYRRYRTITSLQEERQRHDSYNIVRQYYIF